MPSRHLLLPSTHNKTCPYGKVKRNGNRPCGTNQPTNIIEEERKVKKREYEYDYDYKHVHITRRVRSCSISCSKLAMRSCACSKASNTSFLPCRWQGASTTGSRLARCAKTPAATTMRLLPMRKAIACSTRSTRMTRCARRCWWNACNRCSVQPSSPADRSRCMPARHRSSSSAIRGRQIAR